MKKIIINILSYLYISIFINQLKSYQQTKLKIVQDCILVLHGLGSLNKKKYIDTYNVFKEIVPTLYEKEYCKQLLHQSSVKKLVPFKEEYLQNNFKLST